MVDPAALCFEPDSSHGRSIQHTICNYKLYPFSQCDIYYKRTLQGPKDVGNEGQNEIVT